MGMMGNPMAGRGGFAGGMQQGHFNPAFIQGQGASGQYQSGGPNKRFKQEEMV